MIRLRTQVPALSSPGNSRNAGAAPEVSRWGEVSSAASKGDVNGWPSSPRPCTCKVMTVLSGRTFTVTVAVSQWSMLTGQGESKLALTSS